MSRTATQTDNPWIAKVHFDLLQSRCAEAEACLRAVLAVIDPELLERHAGDWKTASAEVCGS
jgi:hypothetical protein